MILLTTSFLKYILCLLHVEIIWSLDAYHDADALG